MWHIEVLVADATYHKNAPLTYASNVRLEVGRIVIVPLQQKKVLGVVSSVVGQPAFAAKKIIGAPLIPKMPAELYQLLGWMRSYYPAPLGMTTQLFLPGSLPLKPLDTTDQSIINEETLPKLTSDQQQALESIKASGLHILHGETGSGKTRVYLELALHSFKRGKSSIVLTPEIGLTSQLYGIFHSVFGERVVAMHSGLSETTRRRTWQWLLEQKGPVIVIGARSALFSPVSGVGLIVVDEAHETSYKQDQAPYYHAATVAAKLGRLHEAAVILGSATPLVSDYFIAESKGRPIVRMTEIAAGEAQKRLDVEVVDLKDRSHFNRSPYLSNQLVKAIKTKLETKEQVLLFLNRRGTARVIFCEKCGWKAVCPRCDLPLVYHGDHHQMRCHSCSYKSPAPGNCPQCKSTDIVFKSIGTKAIADEVKRLFPEARLMRFDTDNTKGERLEAHYDKIHSGEVDIIIGTQTLAKGLDLPRLGVVGVIIADTSLYFPDFSAQERTYQLLTQVLGRVGRGHRQGAAIIQTYSPNGPLIKSVLAKDWSAFYNSELDERRKFLFPPFCYLLKLTCKRASLSSAQKTAEKLASELRSTNNNIVVEGPAPAFHEKTQDKFVWQLVVKAKRREYLTDIIKKLPSGWLHDIDPMNLL